MIEVIRPNWTANPRVHALCTTRVGGVSIGSYHALNLATHVGDDPRAVALNRSRLSEQLELPNPPTWLNQVHGTAVVSASTQDIPTADATYTRDLGVVCAILTADCLPILLCDREATIVVAIHAGWRGLFEQIIAKTLAPLCTSARSWQAWIGPGISAGAYQVGLELRRQFIDIDPNHAAFFTLCNVSCRADLAGIAAYQLEQAGVRSIARYAGCTAGEPDRFFSYRRDGQCGRMASLIWLT